MRCAICGIQFNNPQGVCPICTHLGRSRPVLNSTANEEFIPARFWLRLGAVLIDGTIIFLAQEAVIAVAIAVGFGMLFDLTMLSAVITKFISPVSGMTFFSMMLSGFLMAMISVLIPLALSSMLYYACFEASSFLATPGKLLFGLRVTDKDGNRLKFFRSLARNLLKLLSWLPFGLGFIMAGIGAQKRALHDLLSGCVVVRNSSLTARQIMLAIICAVVCVLTIVMFPKREPSRPDHKADKVQVYWPRTNISKMTK